MKTIIALSTSWSSSHQLNTMIGTTAFNALLAHPWYTKYLTAKVTVPQYHIVDKGAFYYVYAVTDSDHMYKFDILRASNKLTNAHAFRFEGVNSTSRLKAWTYKWSYSDIKGMK